MYSWLILRALDGRSQGVVSEDQAHTCGGAKREARGEPTKACYPGSADREPVWTESVTHPLDRNRLLPIAQNRPSVCAPPHTARTEQLSITARDQSMSPTRASQFRSAKCMRSQMPSRCQSRNRRQHVMPDPQLISDGNICHRIPLRRMNKIPVRHARSETRGRPPFGRGGGTEEPVTKPTG
jgi:hypothetical protein